MSIALPPREEILLSITEFIMLVPQECAEHKHLEAVYDRIQACGELSSELKAICLKSAERAMEVLQFKGGALVPESMFDTVTIINSIYYAIHFDDPMRLSNIRLMKKAEEK